MLGGVLPRTTWRVRYAPQMRWLGIGILATSVSCGRSHFDVDASNADAAIDATERANHVFTTSTFHDGNLGGLAGADAICQQRATEAGLPGSFIAFLSTEAIPARTRLDGSRGWQRVDGAPVVDLLADLFNLRGWNPIATDEYGRDVRASNNFVWTGSDSTGGPVTGVVCNEWTTGSSAVSGRFGSSARGATQLFNHGYQPCQRSSRLYCFEVGARRVSPPIPTPGRLAFISMSTWPAASGIASADALCQSEAAGAGRQGTFKAALPPSGATTASRFSLSGAPWVRADGVLLATTPNELFAGSLLRSHFAMTANGDPLPEYGSGFWTGGDPNSVNGNTCMGWTSVTGMAEQGDSEDTLLASRFVAFGTPLACSGAARLLCLED